MQLYPHNIEFKLGFDKVKGSIESNCTSDLGRARVGEMVVLNDPRAINLLLDATSELLKQISSGDSFPEVRAF